MNLQLPLFGVQWHATKVTAGFWLQLFTVPVATEMISLKVHESRGTRTSCCPCKHPGGGYRLRAYSLA